MQIDTLVQETCKQITTLFSPEFIYLESICPVPFDVILYTPEQWKKCLQDSMSFANTIVKTGVKIYG